MTYLQNPRHYGRAEFRTFVDTLSWDKGWKPKFPTLHNTGNPSLKQWIAYGPTTEERWGANLNRYYQGLAWHSAVHLVCCPDYIWNLCDLEQDGVSVSCWNHLTIGIEMVGDFSIGADNPSVGDGAKVIDNAVWALAVLSQKLGWNIGAIIRGVGGLHFHRECVQDHHSCPGGLVDKGDVLKRVLAQMAAFSGAPVGVAVSAATVAAPAPPLPPAPAADPLAADVRSIQSFLVAAGYDLDIDGLMDPNGETVKALADYRVKHKD